MPPWAMSFGEWPEDVSSRIKRDAGGCWFWMGHIASHGYGTLSRKGTQHYAHRLVYELAKGPIPDGLQLDHLCRMRHCVNPDHLEPVTQSENTRRGLSAVQMAARHAARTHCKWGHEFTPENTRQETNGRSCIQCEKDRYQRTKAPPKPPRTRCKNGHAWDAANTRWTPGSTRVCRTCHRERENRRYREKVSS